jgi:hypothetical protein
MPTESRMITTHLESHSLEEIEQIVVMTRLNLYNRGLPCGASALRRHLREQDSIRPTPSVRRIGQWLRRHGLTHARTGCYEGEE